MKHGLVICLACIAFVASTVATGAASSGKPPLATSERVWDADHAAHLLRRAGFGGTPEEIERLVQLGRRGAVNYLLNGESVAFDFPPPGLLPQALPVGLTRPDLTDAQRQDWQRFRRQNDHVEFANLSQWWVSRMIATPRPLEEKMVLFWHGHFTSGMREVRDPLKMYNQNELFRKYALADFRTLLYEISLDPAMLVYLDNAKNIARHPNENYVRELLELFTMGEGHYSESDIQEAARAFTGWSVDRMTGESVFRPGRHDWGPKQVLGRAGDLKGGDVIDIILREPATAEYMARKLWRFFAATEPDNRLVRSLAAVLRHSDYDFKVFLRRMFMCDAFYAPDVRFQNIKSPVELLVGTCRLLDIKPVDSLAMTRSLKQMGQELFQPPNVKGWDGGEKWVNAAALFARYDVLRGLVYGTRARPMRPAQPPGSLGASPAIRVAVPEAIDDQPLYDPAPLLRKHQLKTAEQIVDHFSRRLLQQPVSADDRTLLIDHLRRVGGDLDPSSRRTADAVRGLLHLIMSMPEYQVS